jgi:chemotaxis protein MotB
VVLARQVQELQRYRSDFFGRLRELLSDRKDIRVVGDRFVFQSEVLFPSGQATDDGRGACCHGQLAAAIVEMERTIPKEIDWAPAGRRATPTSGQSPARSFRPTGSCRAHAPPRW